MKYIKRPKPKANSNVQSAIQSALAFLLLCVGWLMWDARIQETSMSSEKSIAVNTRFAPLTLDRINRHMQLTEKKSELRTLAMEMENVDLSPPLKDSNLRTHQEVYPGPAVNQFESENVAARVLRDTGERTDQEFDNPYLPQDRVTAMLERDQWNGKYDKQQLEAYVAQVRANARAAGYVIEINDQLEITRARRAPNSIAPPEVEKPASTQAARKGAPVAAK